MYVCSRGVDMKIVMIGGWWGKVGHFFGVVGWWWWWRSRKASGGGGGWWGKGGQFGNLLGWKSTARSKELRRKSDSLPRCTEKENIEIGFLKVTIFLSQINSIYIFLLHIYQMIHTVDLLILVSYILKQQHFFFRKMRFTVRENHFREDSLVVSSSISSPSLIIQHQFERICFISHHLWTINILFFHH